MNSIGYTKQSNKARELTSFKISSLNKNNRNYKLFNNVYQNYNSLVKQIIIKLMTKPWMLICWMAEINFSNLMSLITKFFLKTLPDKQFIG